MKKHKKMVLDVVLGVMIAVAALALLRALS